MKSGVVLVIVYWIPACLCACIHCPLDLTVDITESDYDPFTGSRTTTDNITYTQFDYYVQNGTIRGCICNLKTCVRKCCQKSEEISSRKQCEPVVVERDFSDVVSENLTYVQVHSFLTCNNKQRFQLYPIEGKEFDEFSIDESGQLRHRYLTIDVNNYCLDYFSSVNVTGALICMAYQEDESDPLYYYGKL